jgi:hypothetical protein
MFPGLPDSAMTVLEALWRFCPEVELPFPLVKLAVEVDTGSFWDSQMLKTVLDSIVNANHLIRVSTTNDLAAPGKIIYKVSPEVSAELNRQDRPSLFEVLPAGLGPVQLTKAERQRKQHLLATLLSAYGRVQDAQNVPQLAAQFLQIPPHNRFDGWGARMVIAAFESHGASIEDWLKEGLRQLLDYFFSRRSAGERQFLLQVGAAVVLV